MTALTAAALSARCTPMLVAHLDAVVALEQRIYPFPWSRGNFNDALKSGYPGWLLQEDGRVEAYAVMMLALDEAQLLNISVAPERRRAGLGGALLAYLFTLAQQGGATRMFLEVRPSNAQALALYRRHGFTQVGIRRGYYPAQQGREDALVLARTL